MDHFAGALEEVGKQLQRVQESYDGTRAAIEQAIADGDYASLCPDVPALCNGTLPVSSIGVIDCPADPCPHAAARRTARFQRYLQKFGLWELFAEVGIEAITNHAPPTVRRYCETVDARIAAGDGLFLAGAPGRGKTTLLGLIAAHAIDARRSVVLDDAVALFERLKQRYSKDKSEAAPRLDAVERAMHCELWLLDDLGTEDRQWAWDAFRQIVDHRWKHRLSTVVTTNLTAQDLRDDRMFAREHSRLTERCVWTPMTGPSLRGTATADGW